MSEPTHTTTTADQLQRGQTVLTPITRRELVVVEIAGFPDGVWIEWDDDTTGMYPAGSKVVVVE